MFICNRKEKNLMFSTGFLKYFECKINLFIFVKFEALKVDKKVTKATSSMTQYLNAWKSCKKSFSKTLSNKICHQKLKQSIKSDDSFVALSFEYFIRETEAERSAPSTLLHFLWYESARSFVEFFFVAIQQTFCWSRIKTFTPDLCRCQQFFISLFLIVKPTDYKKNFFLILQAIW